jgi:hypothetical protein
MTALAVKTQDPQESWIVLKEQASMLVKTGFLPPALNTPEKVIAVSLKGKELGIPMMEAISSINIIQGKPTVSPQLMLALALRTGQVEYHTLDSSEEGAKFTVKRRGHPAHVAVFGKKEASDMGLLTKDNYKKQAKTMFEWRAIAKGLRAKFPDAISGLYTPEELGAAISEREDGALELTGDVDKSIDIPMPTEKKEDSPFLEPMKPTAVMINTNQRKFLFAKMRSVSLTEPEMRAILKEKYGTEHTNDLTEEQFNEVVAILDKMEEPPEE